MLKSLNKFLTSNYTKCKPWGQRRATIGCKGGFCSATWGQLQVSNVALRSLVNVLSGFIKNLW